MIIGVDRGWSSSYAASVLLGKLGSTAVITVTSIEKQPFGHVWCVAQVMVVTLKTLKPFVLSQF